MKRLSVFLALAITINVVCGMTFRHKRQLSDSEDANDLEEKYGEGPSWNRPSRWPQQNQNGNQWNRPNQDGNQWNPNQNGNQWTRPDQGGNQPQPTPAPIPNGSTTQSTSVQDCIRLCPVTPEYNPVCGTNLVQYTNPGRLQCAQECGVNVSLLRSSPCPASTTAAPVS